MLGCRYQTVLDAAEAAERLLISPRMEETDILRLTECELRKEDGVGVGFAAVIVLAVARKPAEEHPLVLLVPIIDGEQRITLVDAPDVRQRRHERTVNHVPALPVVLLLLIDDGEEGGTALAYRERTELGKDIRLLHPVGIADILNLRHNLLGHILVIVVEGERILYRETAAYVQRIEFRRKFLQFAVDLDALVQLVPIVGRILDTGIDEEVEHLELHLLVVLYPFLIIRYDIVVADTEARGVEIELRFLLRRDADSYLTRLLDDVQQVELLLIVYHRNGIGETAVYQVGDVLHILRTLEPVAYDVNVLVNQSALIKRIDDMDVVGRRCLEIYLILQGLFQHEREMRTFRTVTVIVGTLVIDLGHRHVEHALGTVYLLRYLRQIGDFQRRPVLLDNIHQRDFVEVEFVILHRKFILWELERLFDKVDVLVFHLIADYYR